jgi:hypothetical protein
LDQRQHLCWILAGHGTLLTVKPKPCFQLEIGFISRFRVCCRQTVSNGGVTVGWPVVGWPVNRAEPGNRGKQPGSRLKEIDREYRERVPG